MFDNTNSDILTCDQILSYYHNFSPPARSSGCEEIVREYLVRGWIECRDYPPTEGQPYDSASGFEYGRNWQVTLGWDGQGSPSNAHSWFLMAYADLTKNNVYMGYPYDFRKPIRLDDVLPQHIKFSENADGTDN